MQEYYCLHLRGYLTTIHKTERGFVAAVPELKLKLLAPSFEVATWAMRLELTLHSYAQPIYPALPLES